MLPLYKNRCATHIPSVFLIFIVIFFVFLSPRGSSQSEESNQNKFTLLKRQAQEKEALSFQYETKKMCLEKKKKEKENNDM